MVHRLTPGYAAPGSVSHIPLNPRGSDWASKIPFWSKAAWKELKKKSKEPVRLDSSIASAFLEDEHGHAVSDEVLKSVYKDVRGFFADKYSDPETRGDLGPRDKIGLRIGEEFRVLFEGKYPWLRLCDGHWKVQQLWTNVWSSWHTNQKLRSTPTSDDDKKVSIGVKRCATDEDDDVTEIPAKRIKENGNENGKGKGVDRPQVPTTSAQPKPQASISSTQPKPQASTSSAQPKPTKITAKLPGVSISIPRPYCFHTHERCLEETTVFISSFPRLPDRNIDVSFQREPQDHPHRVPKCYHGVYS